jgi:hypothetical protein
MNMIMNMNAAASIGRMGRIGLAGAGAVATAAGIGPRAAGAEIHVPRDHPYIQAAVDAAADGDEIVLAPGTHGGFGNRDIDLRGKAITVRSTDPADPAVVAATVVDGLLAARLFHLHGGETLATTIDGLTIVHGFAAKGAAVLIEDGSSATLRRCVLGGHVAGASGGAVQSDDFPTEPGALAMIDCAVTGTQVGHGIVTLFLEELTLDRCAVSANAGMGVKAGLYGTTTATIRECTVAANGAGGMSLTNTRDLTVSASAFTGNGGVGLSAAQTLGGGSALIERCTISGNVASSGVGGFSLHADTAAVVRSCIVAGNTGQVGGMSISGFGAFEIIGCTIAHNTATLHGGGGLRAFGTDPTLVTSCILWGNAAPEGAQLHLDSGFNNPAVVTIEFSDVTGGAAAVFVDPECCTPSTLVYGPGNVDLDPLFVDASAGDVHVTATSPVIDAGDPAYVAAAGETDIDGDARVAGGAIDMGADEVVVAPVGDLDGDGNVDFADLLALLAAWGPCPGCPEDLDDSGAVGFSDLLILLAAWS